MKYFPEGPPFQPTPDVLAEWAVREMQRISGAIDTIHDHTVDHADLDRPARGMTRYFDGSDYDPGQGEGPYYHNGAEWLKTGNWLNVKAYGATLDGSTDDTTAFSDAITAAGVGGTILIPQGIAVISSQLDLLDGQRLVGAGVPANDIASPYLPTLEDGTLIKYTGASDFAFRVNDKNNVCFENLSFVAPSTSGGCIQITASEYCKVRNCIFRSVPTGSAIHLVNQSYFNIVEDSMFKTSIKWGIYISGTTVNNNIFRNIEISGAAVTIGIYLTSGNNNIFDTVTVEPVATTAHIKMVAAHAVFSDLRLEGTVGTEGWISMDSASRIEVDRSLLGHKGRFLSGAPMDGDLGLFKNGFNNLISDPTYRKAGSYPDGFSLTYGSVSTAERVATIPEFAHSGYSWHGISTAGSVVDVTFTVNSAALLAAIADRDVKIGAWIKQTAGSGAGLVAKALHSVSAAASSTVNIVASDKWSYLETAVPAENDVTSFQMIIRMGASGNDALFYMPTIVISGNDLVSCDRLIPSTGGRFCGPMSNTIHTLADNATPSVLDGSVFLTGGTTTITDFDDGVTGQKIEIISEHAITITDGTNIFLNGSANWTMAATDTLTLRQKADSKWYEIARSDNT